MDVAMAYGHSAVGFTLATHIKRQYDIRYDKSSLDELYERGELVRLSASGFEPALASGHLARAGAVIASTVARMAQEALQRPTLGLPIPKGLTASQGACWASMVAHGWGVLTGGPGVGKTYILAKLIWALREAGKSMVICAPTGKAASVLGLKVGGGVTTIHRAIGLVPGQIPSANRHNPLQVDYVFVDETSMVDELLMGMLFDAIDPKKTMLILSGDPDQLAPVSCGAPFQVLCKHKLVPTVRLTEVIRQQDGSGIVNLRNASMCVAASVNSIVSLRKTWPSPLRAGYAISSQYEFGTRRREC